MTENNSQQGFSPATIGIVLVAILILVVGFVSITSVVDSIDGTNAMNNCTAATTNTVYGIVPMLILVGGMVLVVGLISWYVSTPYRYQITNKRIKKLISFLNTTTVYFAYGLLSYAIFGTVAVCLYLAYRLTLVAGETGVGIEIGKWILIIVAFYFATAGIGYLFKRFIWNKYQKRKEELKMVENMKELPGGIND